MAFLTSSDKALWHLALPMIFSNITVPLLGLVDTAVIGHLDSPVYLGGVAVGATATSFLFMLLLFLRMSTTGLTAQAYGAKNPQALARAHLGKICSWPWPDERRILHSDLKRPLVRNVWSLFSATDGIRPGGDGLCGTVYRPGCHVANYAH